MNVKMSLSPWGPLQFSIRPITQKRALHIFCIKTYDKYRFLQTFSSTVQISYRILAKFSPNMYV